MGVVHPPLPSFRAELGLANEQLLHFACTPSGAAAYKCLLTNFEQIHYSSHPVTSRPPTPDNLILLSLLSKAGVTQSILPLAGCLITAEPSRAEALADSNQRTQYGSWWWPWEGHVPSRNPPWAFYPEAWTLPNNMHTSEQKPFLQTKRVPAYTHPRLLAGRYRDLHNSKEKDTL